MLADATHAPRPGARPHGDECTASAATCATTLLGTFTANSGTHFISRIRPKSSSRPLLFPFFHVDKTQASKAIDANYLHKFREFGPPRFSYLLPNRS
jgi:hypothetical protein